MDPRLAESTARKATIDKLIELATRAFKPDADPTTRGQDERAFDEFVQRTGTLALVPALNFLILPGRVPPLLRSRFIHILARIPLRPDGVRSTLEFIFSVHPSSTVGAPEEASLHKQGANITQEALKMATQLLGNPAIGVTPESWFLGIAPQLLALLDGKDGPELMKVASYVIGFGILGRKQYGAPGSPGWTAFAEPILSSLNPSIAASSDGTLTDDEGAGVIDLTRHTILVSPDSLSSALFRLQALLISHPNPGLSRRLMHPVILSLWALSSWREPSAQCEERCCLPARNLLKIYLRITTSPERLTSIIQNLLYNGNTKDHARQWLFQANDAQTLEIARLRSSEQTDRLMFDWAEVDRKADTLLELFQSVATPEDISAVFMDLFGRWIERNRSAVKPRVLHKREEEEAEAASPLSQLSEAKVLQKMMEKFPEQLVAQPDSILDILEPVLTVDAAGDDDETTAVALSLLNLVVTAPNFQKSQVKIATLKSVEASLVHLANEGKGDISITSRNLSMLLRYRDEMQDPADVTSTPTDRHVEDRKTYNLAMSYITQPDSPPPVRSEGIHLLQDLITAGSPILDIPAILVLMSSLLNDNEDYVNLRVIKVFTQLANRHPTAVTKELLEHYVDANETTVVDARLRFGEALLQVIERLGETFAGETAKQVSEALLSTAGRRGYRPKTEQKQARQEKLQKMKQRQAEEAWGGEVPDLGEDIPDEEKARNEILSRIVGGWESKRGSEDVRIRASALSVMGVGIETNIAGMGSSVVSTAVDLSVNILTIEREEEKGILRRSAALLIMSFLRALEKAKQAGKRLGFGLTPESQEDIKRVLGYVAQTDIDGLVQQHAKDVVESLENWQMGSFISEARTQGPDLTRLAGLSINPESSVSTNNPRGPDLTRLAGLSINPESSVSTNNPRDRPKIEEIE